MSEKPSVDVTRMLAAVEQGDAQASAELLPLLYSELRKLARSLMAKMPPGNTLQPTALVHEAYLRLVGSQDPNWSGRGHFFSAAAQAMRQILVDQARRKGAQKRGGGQPRLRVSEAEREGLMIQSPVENILELDKALARLEQEAPRKAEVVKLLYFAGLSAAETASLLGISRPTVERDWKFARALLHAELAEGDAIP